MLESSRTGRARLACFACFALTGLAAPLWAQAQFALPLLPTPSAPGAIAVIDLGGDDLPDLVTANSFSGNVSLLRATPGGGYLPALNWPAGSLPTGLGVADMDLDGDEDVLALSRNTSQLVILLLADGGESVTTSTYPLAGNPEALAVGDLDADGDIDVVAVETQLDRISVRLGLGPAGLGPVATYPVGIVPEDVVLVDLDGDGFLDVVTANVVSHDVSLLHGDGAGGFLPAASVATGGSSRVLAVADYDGDGLADVAVGRNPPSVRLLLGDGAGGLLPGALFPLNHFMSALETGELNNDGWPDLVSISASSSGFDVLESAGAGTFEPVVDYLPSTGDAGALVDLDADGRTDFAVDSGSGVVLVIGDGEGGFIEPTQSFLTPALTLVTIADVNGDGISDLLGGQQPGAALEARLGDGSGGLGPGIVSPLSVFGILETAELDGDGALDVLTGNFGSLEINLGDGLGGFTPAGTFLLFEYFMDAEAADMNGDGATDVVILTSSGFFGQESHSVGVLLGDGAGGLSWGQNLVQYGTYGTQPFWDKLALGDLDGDGDRDVAIVDATQAMARLFLNAGTGELSGAGSVAVPGSAGTRTNPLLLADLDDDDDLDVVVRTATGVSALFGNGDGSFGAATPVASTKSGQTVVAADLEGDGYVDLVTDTLPTGFFFVLRGDGEGGFVPSQFKTIGRPLLAQLDGDGRPDVIGLSPVTGAVSSAFISLNRSLVAQWADLGYGLAGTNGVPKLVGTGILEPGSAGSLKLSNANPNKLAVLFISKQSNPAPFKGGILATVPPLSSFMLVTNPTGAINLSWTNWPGGAPGSTWYFQYGVVDAGGPAGAALSNAVRGTQP